MKCLTVDFGWKQEWSIKMSHNPQFNNIGEQITSALNDALATGNYEGLKSVISDTVTSALNEAGAASSKAWQQRQTWNQQQDELKRRQEEWKRQQEIKEQQERAARERKEKAEREQREAALRQRNEMIQQQRYQKTGLLVEVKNKGLVAGILFIVFGAIANIPLAILSLIGVLSGWGAAGYLLFFLLVSIFFICFGKSKIELIEKAKRYVRLCGNKMYGEVEELAAQVGISPKKVERELRKILQKGIIPSAHMDKKGTNLMLNEVIYKQYTDAEKARVLREKEEKENEKAKIREKKEKGKKEKEQKESAEPLAAETVEQKTEFEQMMEEGQECIKKLRNLNDMIPGEAISSKLYQLENLLKEIFQRVQKEPTQMNRMHKVMNYYLPTTLKLVEAYREFDMISNPNDDIMSAKAEIEETLDTINEAFEELLNSLFQDKVLDITTDAQVLQTMLASEGLTKEMDMVKVNH